MVVSSEDAETRGGVEKFSHQRCAPNISLGMCLPRPPTKTYMMRIFVCAASQIHSRPRSPNGKMLSYGDYLAIRRRTLLMGYCVTMTIVSLEFSSAP